MALRDQPYLPLYVQDFMTDEKLMECSAAATGVYIRIMCLLHKSEPYGKLLLRQKDRQTDWQIQDFADKLAKHLPYTASVILAGLTELIDEGCLHIDGDFLCQKRMISDNELSIKRSNSGKKGADATHNRSIKVAVANDLAKQLANTEYEYDNTVLGINGEKPFNQKPLPGDLNELPEIKIGAAQQLVKYTQSKDITEKQVTDLWEVFKTQNLTGKKFYASAEDVHSHFINWLKKQDVKSLPGGEKKMVI